MSSREAISDVHHVTAVAGNPQVNVNFYAGLLGLRLVKQTVNHDDPSSYHLCYGDAVGTPGTLLTFFSWAGLSLGRKGCGQAVCLTFAVAESAGLDFWKDRLGQAGVACEMDAAAGYRRLRFSDPDGMHLAIEQGEGSADYRHWAWQEIPESCALRGYREITFCSGDESSTCRLLTESFHLPQERQEDDGRWFRTGRCFLRVISRTAAGAGEIGRGSIHHVALRSRDRSCQDEWRKQIAAAGMTVTPVIDRRYFHSIYFREPGGVLMEIATDGPGFLIDEDADTLGTALQLPPQLEPMRRQIASHLPRLALPQARKRKLKRV